MIFIISTKQRRNHLDSWWNIPATIVYVLFQKKLFCLEIWNIHWWISFLQNDSLSRKFNKYASDDLAGFICILVGNLAASASLMRIGTIESWYCNFSWYIFSCIDLAWIYDQQLGSIRISFDGRLLTFIEFIRKTSRRCDIDCWRLITLSKNHYMSLRIASRKNFKKQIKSINR